MKLKKNYNDQKANSVILKDLVTFHLFDAKTRVITEEYEKKACVILLDSGDNQHLSEKTMCGTVLKIKDCLEKKIQVIFRQDDLLTKSKFNFLSYCGDLYRIVTSEINYKGLMNYVVGLLISSNELEGNYINIKKVMTTKNKGIEQKNILSVKSVDDEDI